MTIACEFSREGHPQNGAGQAAYERTAPAFWRASDNRLLELARSGGTLSETLDSVCRFVEEVSGECRCGIYLIDWRGPTVRTGAAPGLAASFNAAICGLPVRSDSGPCARAAYLMTQVIAADLDSDPLWQASEFRSLALAHGLRSCWCTPICSPAGSVLGIFAILQRSPARPTPFQQNLIAGVAHVASIVIENARLAVTIRRSEAALAETERLSCTGSFVWRLSTDEVIGSGQLHRILELDESQPVTLGLIRSRIHPVDHPSVCEALERARSDGNDIEHEHRLLMPDQSIKYVRMTAHAARDPDGHLEYIGAIQDVTERRLSEAALGKARSELAHVARVVSLGPLSASIVHEVNQPLSGIVINASTCLRMLTADPPNVAGALETVRRALRDARLASEIIARLHALFTKKEPKIGSVELNEVTRELLTLLQSDLQRHRVSLRAELAEDLPPVIGDRVQLQQVILNLLLNALEAMNSIDDRSRRLVVRTEQEDGDRVRLSVSDSGVGLDFQIAERLFEPFYTTKRSGMGIGLFVSRFIIEHHRGWLRAAPNDGPGAMFSFSIPSLGREAMSSCCRAPRGP